MEIVQWLRRFWINREALPTGTAGERRAEEFLRQRGYRVLARNWRSPRDHRDELDLVCRDGDVLVFVEVKTRSADALVSGYYAIDRRKKKVLRRAADAYLKSLAPDRRPRTFRFDVVEVSNFRGKGEEEVRHFENVPLFPKHYWP